MFVEAELEKTGERLDRSCHSRRTEESHEIISAN
jgi:hypothetical protein